MRKENYRFEKIYLFIPVLVAVILLFAVQSSPLYPFNEWVDPNVFLTMGKAILSGKVIYRDIYDQKGPYIYFMHALCALIDGDGFFGVYIMEVIACSVFMYFNLKILKLYGVIDFRRQIIAVILLCFSYCFSYAMSTGDSAEELCVPVVSAVVYLTLKRIKSGGFKKRDYLFAGIAAGFVFWCKFTIAGFFIGWYIFVIVRCIKRKEQKIIPVSILFIASGVIISSVPCFIYFLSNGALKDLFTGYIYNNVFVYQKGNIAVKILRMFLYLLKFLAYNPQFTAFLIIGTVFFSVKGGEERDFFRIVPIVTACFLFIGGRAYRYYGLPLAVFAVTGYAALTGINFSSAAAALEKTVKVVAPTLIIISCAVSFFVNGNPAHIFERKEDTPQYKFAEIINEKENSVLLNYGFIDGGFYLAADQVPDFKYFCLLNIPVEEMYGQTELYIKEGEADFVVVKLWKNSYEELSDEKYEEITREECIYRGKKVVYVLYELKK